MLSNGGIGYLDDFLSDNYSLSDFEKIGWGLGGGETVSIFEGLGDWLSILWLVFVELVFTVSLLLPGPAAKLLFC